MIQIQSKFMESIKQIYRIGHGPSSSHTMGPMRAAQMFLDRNKEAARFNVTLYGSLAATGKGHMTDAAILEVLRPVAETTIVWEPKVFLPFHPNGMLFEAFGANGEKMEAWTVYSIGGGTLANESFSELRNKQVYDMSYGQRHTCPNQSPPAKTFHDEKYKHNIIYTLHNEIRQRSATRQRYILYRKRYGLEVHGQRSNLRHGHNRGKTVAVEQWQQKWKSWYEQREHGRNNKQ